MECVNAEKGLGSYSSFEDFLAPESGCFEHKFSSQTPDIISVWTFLGNQSGHNNNRLFGWYVFPPLCLFKWQKIQAPLMPFSAGLLFCREFVSRVSTGSKVVYIRRVDNPIGCQRFKFTDGIKVHGSSWIQVHRRFRRQTVKNRSSKAWKCIQRQMNGK